MLTKSFITVFAALTLMLALVRVTIAQTGELRGHVVIVQANGQTVPASEATIDVYRTDISGKYETKANKKGEFVFAGLPFVGKYIVVASHPTGEFNWKSGVRVGQATDLEIRLSPGNGKRPTLDEIKALEKQGGAASAGASSSESASDKAKREELIRKNEEIAARNKKIEESNAIVGRTFNAGNEALKAKNYDEALKQYEAGLAADPDVPALFTQKAIALKARGVDRYNAAINSKDDAAKASGFDAAKKDFAAAAAVSKKSVDLLKARTVPTDPQELASYQGNMHAALATRAETMRLFVTKVDQSQVEAGEAAYQEYIASETDATKKAQAERDFAQMLFDANSFDKALAAYKKILAANPNDTDALVNSGMLLFNIAAMNNDKKKYQEAASFLQRFVDIAPDSDRFKEDAKVILEELKNQHNVKAETTPATPTRRRRP
ncbi:MAG: tetratricopeptide repeat protein [Pyrinomonadaceae bacterium]